MCVHKRLCIYICIYILYIYIYILFYIYIYLFIYLFIFIYVIYTLTFMLHGVHGGCPKYSAEDPSSTSLSALRTLLTSGDATGAKCGLLVGAGITLVRVPSGNLT